MYHINKKSNSIYLVDKDIINRKNITKYTNATSIKLPSDNKPNDIGIDIIKSYMLNPTFTTNFFQNVLDLLKIVISRIYIDHFYLLNNLDLGLPKPKLYHDIGILINSQSNKSDDNMFYKITKVTSDKLKQKISKVLIKRVEPEFELIYIYFNKVMLFLQSIISNKITYECIGTSLVIGLSEPRAHEILSSITLNLLYISQHYQNIHNIVQDLNMLIEMHDITKDTIIYTNKRQIMNLLFYFIKDYKYKLISLSELNNLSISDINNEATTEDYQLFMSIVF
jgi:hypothetical protein